MNVYSLFMSIPRRTFLAKAGTLTLGGTISLLLPSPVSNAQNLIKPKHLEDALELLYGLDSHPENNNYQHKNISVTWKNVNGASDYVSKADCSGFISELLRHSYSDYFTLKRFEQWMKEKRSRPLAEDFHNAIITQKDFVQIKKLTQVQPGDMIAIKYREKEDNDENKENGKPPTGHVMLVTETPKRRKSSDPVEEGTTQWQVKVIDQSRSGHGNKDTRRKPNNFSPCKEKERYRAFYSGLGQGMLRVYTNEDEDIFGYTWSTNCSPKKPYIQEQKNLVIGRLNL